LTRLLVVSDSHGKVDYIYDVIRKHQGDFDVFVHLGDKSYDMLSFLNDVSSLIMVKGNMETVFPDMNMEVEKGVKSYKKIIIKRMAYVIKKTSKDRKIK